MGNLIVIAELGRPAPMKSLRFWLTSGFSHSKSDTGNMGHSCIGLLRICTGLMQSIQTHWTTFISMFFCSNKVMCNCILFIFYLSTACSSLVFDIKQVQNDHQITSVQRSLHFWLRTERGVVVHFFMISCEQSPMVYRDICTHVSASDAENASCPIRNW